MARSNAIRKIAVVPAAPQVPPAKRLHWTLDSITQDIDSTIASAKAEVKAFGEKIATNEVNPFGEIGYQLRWAGNIAETAAYAFLVQSLAFAFDCAKRDGKSRAEAMLHALQHEVGSATDALMHDKLSGGSTSAFSNANDQAKRAAASQFVRFFGARVERIQKAMAAVVAEQATEVFFTP